MKNVHDRCDIVALTKKVMHYARIINAPNSFLPTFDFSREDATPYVKLDNQGYHYIINERGNVFEDFITTDEAEILYKIFSSVTFNMACSYELKNRKMNQDCRRIRFAKQLDLLGLIDENLMKRKEEDFSRILQDYPFRDDNIDHQQGCQ